MEFWGLEVKPNQFIKVSPEDDHFLHLSQAALGEVKKDDKTTLFVRVDGSQKLAIGTLSIDKFPHIRFDLVFDKEFELSHNSKTTHVFFSGYNVFQPSQGDEYPFLHYTHTCIL
ncbi:histone deacetylase HDT2-like [Hordeum vulgare subsp. vulgare]|uniref:histone deacetylase HDT2-like n=1 Tax=Hordeum vulgare subsp. vulgare TaxID=112509 RepID=UPI001D1A4CDA|nr:histone deacetylase HDT2-like [Hordeum vulgare subsp. vulgare]